MNGTRLLLPLLLAALALVASEARAQQGVNPIHPTFVPLDAQGQPVKGADGFSDERTCAGCHDVAFIASHSGHAAAGRKATCAQCHVDGGRLDIRPETLDEKGSLRREALRIGSPAAQNCASCHGLVFGSGAAVALPADFDAAPDGSGRSFTLTHGEGAIVAPQPMNDSFLGLEGKDRLAAPWDVHAAKLVDCASCHFAGNNPVHADEKHTRLRYLTEDPRRVSTAEYLARPDHRLAEKSCRGCHDPMKAHEFLPYRARHMEALACQGCHAPGPRGPALEMLDATVATLDGKPAVRFRNLERRPGEALSAARITPLRPLMVERADSDGVRRLTPVNPVSRWRWVSGPSREPVDFALVVQAFVEDGRYVPEVLTALDANRDGKLDEAELRLETKAKADLVAARLRAAGVADPAIDGTLQAYAIAHGISTRDQALRDCNACHAADSRLSTSYPIAAYLPGGVPPRPPESARVELSGVLEPAGGGGLALRGAEATAPGGLHVLGYSRQGLTNTLGFLLFLAVLVGVSLHGLARFVLGRGKAAHAGAIEKSYAFGLYERIWHWTMALSGLALIVTGLQIHTAGGPWPLSLPTAVALHNAFAVILMANAFLALFYHLATAAIRNFLPSPKGLVGRLLEHMSYYARGIYFGGPHPANEPGKKLNPLQQLTYLALLNVLFPFQIATGLLLWAVGHWPQVAAAVGGLRYLAPAHNLGSWLFLSFFVLHVYLVTTGRTLGEHLQSMITGYQAVETAEQPKS